MRGIRTIEQAKKYVEENSTSVLLEDKWINSTTPMRFRCSCGNEFTSTWNKFKSQNKRRCNECAKKEQYEQKRLPMDKVIEMVEAAGCEYVSGEYKNQKSVLNVRCSCGKVFPVIFDNLTNGRSGLCPECMHKAQAVQQAYTLPEVAMIAWAYDAELLSDSYSNAHEPLRFRCKCGREFTTTMNRFTTLGKTRCDTCSGRESQGEKRIREWLEARGIEYECQKRFIDCRGKRPYPFDFYLPKQNICIEYDGVQHLFPPEFFGDPDLMKARDAAKTAYCESKGMQLIRIPYTEYKDIPQLLGMLIPR